jgi:hypothetical protein
MDEWQAAQHADECKLQEDIDKALDAALVRPLTFDEVMLLAWAGGRASDFYKHHRT